MKKVTSKGLIGFVDSLREKKLTTLSGNKPFLANAGSKQLSFFNTKNNIRVESEKRLNQICDKFNRIRSFTTSDYTDITVNASYVLAVIAAFLNDEENDEEQLV